MSKKDLLDDITEEEEEDIDIITDTPNDIIDSDNPINPMGLANLISKESETSKNFIEMPKEVRFSFLDQNDKLDVKHFARSYRNWKYIDKIITLRDMEDKKISKNKIKVCNISTIQQLLDYLKQEKKDYLIPILEKINDKEKKEIFNYFKDSTPDFYLSSINKSKKDIDDLYKIYEEDNEIPIYVDDMDNLGKVIDTSVSSMGYKGNASSHAVMTINAVKNEDISKKAEEKSSFSFLDSIKKRFG